MYVGFGTSVYAFSPDGVPLWSYDTGNVVTSFPVIAGTASKNTGGHAVIYVASSDWKLLKDTHIAIQPALSGLSHTAAASFASVDNNTGPRLGVVLRFQDPRNYYLLYRQMGGSSQLRISRIMNGFETILASAGTPQATVNTFFRITAEATGTDLTLKLCSATDTSTGTACNTFVQKVTAKDSMLGGGSVGVLIGTGTGSTQQYRVDKFAAQVQ